MIDKQKIYRRIGLIILFIIIFYNPISEIRENRLKKSAIESAIRIYRDSTYSNNFKGEQIYKKPSLNMESFNSFRFKYYSIVSYKEEEIIDNKKYTNYAIYIRDSENRYYAVDGRIFCLGIPCIDN
jgi:hypothetical protein